MWGGQGAGWGGGRYSLFVALSPQLVCPLPAPYLPPPPPGGLLALTRLVKALLRTVRCGEPLHHLLIQGAEIVALLMKVCGEGAEGHKV